MDASILVTFILYLGLMVLIGFIYYKRTKIFSDYLLGGRQLNSWVTAFSAQASDMSGWLLLGLPGFAYLYGLEAMWIAVGLAVGTYLNWRFISSRLRIYTELAGNAITLPDFFHNRFQSEKNGLRILTALFILCFFMIYTASGFVAGAKLFSTVFHFSYQAALVIGVLVIIAYTFLGGFMAVCWTDLVQGLLMFISIAILPILAIIAAGGIASTSGKLNGFGEHLLHPMISTSGEALSGVALFSLLAWGLGYFGQPHILSRFMAIQSRDRIPKARRIAMIWVLISLSGAVIVGLAGRACLLEPLTAETSETVFMVLVKALVPPFLSGILLSAVLAAIMSTADSQLLVAASALAEDLYRPLIRKQAGTKELLWIGRLAVVVIALIALLIALNPESSVLDLVSYAWAGFGAAFGPVVILSLFWRRMTYRGAVAGILSGGLTVLVWKHLSGGLFDLYEIVPGFIISLSAIFLFSLLDRPPSNAVTDQFKRSNLVTNNR